MRRLVFLGILAMSCHPDHKPVRPAVDAAEIAELVEVAHAEVRREGGVADLERLATSKYPQVRAAAVRGLGRVGALAIPESHLADGDDADSAAAIGFAGSLGTVEAVDAARLTTALAAVHGPARPQIIEALGRVGDAGGLPAITESLASGDLAEAQAAGIALGMYGRRGIAPDEAAITAAVARSTDEHRDVRHAVVFGLARGYVAPADPATAAPGAEAAAKALAARISDEDAEIRALALGGLARRKARAAAGELALGALADEDWRVQVQAIRLIGSVAPAPSEDDARALAALVLRDWTLLVGGAAMSTVHVVMEGLHVLANATGVREVRQTLDTIADSLTEDLPAARDESLRLAANHVRALTHAALGRATGADLSKQLAIIEGVQLPDEAIGALAVELLTARLDDDPAASKLLLERAGAGQPPGRRAAALGALGDLYVKGLVGPKELIDLVVAAIPDDRPDVAGAAAESAVTIIADMNSKPMLSAPYGLGQMQRALIDRIASATDPELLSSLLGAAGKAAPLDAKPVCEKAWTHANPAVRAAARECLTAATGTDPGPGKAEAPELPPVDPATVIGKRVTWTVETTRGTLVIALDPAAAPWHVASIAKLTAAGFYDGLIFHRVVPDFVVQGGDPTGTGWGGPSYTLPSEPSDRRYTRGAVGIADAGMDTGGSQWFVMHSHAPHLEGRYTVVGELTSGDAAIDQLLVGDRIVKATVTIE